MQIAKLHRLLQPKNCRWNRLLLMQQRLPHSDERRHCRRPTGMVLMIMRQNQPVDLVNSYMP